MKKTCKIIYNKVYFYHGKRHKQRNVYESSASNNLLSKSARPPKNYRDQIVKHHFQVHCYLKESMCSVDTSQKIMKALWVINVETSKLEHALLLAYYYTIPSSWDTYNEKEDKSECSTCTIAEKSDNPRTMEGHRNYFFVNEGEEDIVYSDSIQDYFVLYLKKIIHFSVISFLIEATRNDSQIFCFIIISFFNIWCKGNYWPPFSFILLW